MPRRAIPYLVSFFGLICWTKSALSIGCGCPAGSVRDDSTGSCLKPTLLYSYVSPPGACSARVLESRGKRDGGVASKLCQGAIGVSDDQMRARCLVAAKASQNVWLCCLYPETDACVVGFALHIVPENIRLESIRIDVLTWMRCCLGVVWFRARCLCQ